MAYTLWLIHQQHPYTTMYQYTSYQSIYDSHILLKG